MDSILNEEQQAEFKKSNWEKVFWVFAQRQIQGMYERIYWVTI